MKLKGKTSFEARIAWRASSVISSALQSRGKPANGVVKPDDMLLNVLQFAMDPTAPASALATMNSPFWISCVKPDQEPVSETFGKYCPRACRRLARRAAALASNALSRGCDSRAIEINSVFVHVGRNTSNWLTNSTSAPKLRPTVSRSLRVPTRRADSACSSATESRPAWTCACLASVMMAAWASTRACAISRFSIELST